MKSTIIAVLFLAAGAVADYTVCSQDADKDRYHGRCVIHTDDGKATSKWNPCRKVHRYNKPRAPGNPSVDRLPFHTLFLPKTYYH
ncbi:hypothetical protein Vi05172_g2901 [Venturia inaequalis]|nr:hypothetical protein Vi05172_g2901 [Venturia inaequalis]